MVNMEEIGLELYNLKGSFMATVHLYNTVEKSGLLKIRWVAMDEAIKIHSKQLFIGEIPDDADTSYKRFHIRAMGFGPEMFALDNRGTYPAFSRLMKKKKHAIPRPNLNAILSGYLNEEMTCDQFLHRIDAEFSKSTSNKRNDPTNLDLPKVLRDSLSVKIPNMQTDYVRLSRDSTDLLLRIRQEFSARLNISHVFEGVEIAEVVPLIDLGMVSEILHDNVMSKKRKAAVRGRPCINSFNNDKLEIAAEVLNGFAEEMNNRAAVEPFDVLAATRERMTSKTSFNFSGKQRKRYLELFGE